MNITRVLAAALFAVSFNLDIAEAQSLSKGLVPKEFPPASYKGRQYVDSQGCVFIRAGVDGSVTWVPRVSRSRKVICGFQPSFSNTAPAKSDATMVASGPAPAPQLSKPEAMTAAPAQPARKMVAAKPLPVRVQASKPDVKPTVPGAVSKARLKPVKTRKADGRASSASVQATSPAPMKVVRRVPGDVATYPMRKVRVAPRHVYERQRSSAQSIRVPNGYKPAWEDDRLNRHRTHQTSDGKAKMDLIWTTTVPRRLIDRRTGRVVNPAKAKADGSMVILPTGSVPHKAASHRFVQAGVFTTEAKARAAAQRLANAGLPARMGRVSRNGKAYRVVLAGPFATQAQLSGALGKVRAVGYRDAKLRK